MVEDSREENSYDSLMTDEEEYNYDPLMTDEPFQTHGILLLICVMITLPSECQCFVSNNYV